MEEKWLEGDQLALFDILKERKAKKDSAKKDHRSRKTGASKRDLSGRKKSVCAAIKP